MRGRWKRIDRCWSLNEKKPTGDHKGRPFLDEKFKEHYYALVGVDNWDESVMNYGPYG